MNVKDLDIEIESLIDSLSAEDLIFVSSALLILSQDPALPSPQRIAVNRSRYLLTAIANYRIYETAKPA